MKKLILAFALAAILGLAMVGALEGYWQMKYQMERQARINACEAIRGDADSLICQQDPYPCMDDWHGGGVVFFFGVFVAPGFTLHGPPYQEPLGVR